MKTEYWIFLVAVGALVVVGRALFFQARVSYLRDIHPRWRKTLTKQPCERPVTQEDLPKLRRVLVESGVGIEDLRIPRAEAAGFFMVRSVSYEPVKNLLVTDYELTTTNDQMIGEAIGAYRLKRNDNLNPVHWVMALWSLPKAIAGSIGADRESTVVKLIQLVYQAAIIVSLCWKAAQSLFS